MGRFSTTVHVKNNVDRMRFVNTFSDVMKKRGFVPCSEDEAAQSYLFAFGESWVTLANEEYRDNPQKAYDDTREMAAALKTGAFSVEVVDSDFATLTLNNGDCVIVGDGSGYGIEEPERGTRECWEPVLADGKTWEVFSETVEKDGVFVEDTLGELAVVLGMDSYYICADFDDVSEKADDNNNVVVFYFKKAASKAKSMSLDAAFIKVFGEGLEPLGFKKIKYKHPCFVRRLGDEIIQIITYVKRSGHPYINGYERADCSQYDIVCKVETVYSVEIELPSKTFEKYSGYLSKWDIYVKGHITDFDKDYFNRVRDYFPYKAGDEKLTISGLKKAVDMTKQIILPVLNGITDLKSYLEFYFKFNGEPFLDYKPGHYDHLNKYGGLVRIKVDDTWESFLERDEDYALRGYERSDERTKRDLANNPDKLVLFLEKVDKKRKEYISKHEERELLAKQMFGDKEWCEKAFEELERRKAENIETLKGCGLEL